MAKSTEPQTDASVELFSDFSCELCDRDTNSFYTQPLGKLARCKGQQIRRRLERMATIVHRLLERACWDCHWDCGTFFLESSLSRSEATDELVGAAGTAAEWFQMDGSDDGSDSGAFGRPYVWGPTMTLGAPDPYRPPLPNYETCSVVEIDVLTDFEFEMLFSNVGQQHMDWDAVYCPAIVWPAEGFDLASHLRGLGQTIERRLNRLAAFFDAVVNEVPAWSWEPKAQYAVYDSPLTPRDAHDFIERCDVPMDRVRIETLEDYRRRQK